MCAPRCRHALVDRLRAERRVHHAFAHSARVLTLVRFAAFAPPRDFSMLDTSKIRSDISQLIADCIHLKSVLRTTWTRPMADEQQRLVRVRRTLTDLFVLLAFSRKKLHVTKAPRDCTGDWDAAAYHQKIAMRLLPDYATDGVGALEEVSV